ncbi:MULTISPECIES: Cof-type HAD-IIB family hydrolase [unclassified Candidatus Frackibacter]|uniref:Cof-type HAD-IIB family hydrolase n=1 Tax=unclassified Candidatus Frackibacter TaxID=2648818 RepID=UPI00079AEB32|nr:MULTISPECIES: Cof-type HAD-IIB family hydrolase [unclassified Candidatus Frackibacter]KXS42895.1 MAG: cof family hydrolase [Candidatus Frackibacter sp. T328-2]SDC70991.1 hypothetical protein SAMN04515661_12045 [Candidatus Frackibacter sp. WG11]SEM84566.1 hypothetical protein SAMN04488698_1208 [Candidatus Frackibacter sp. WG12]SFL93815.1 hypothetical protein SAMN04488699_1218 [Candidatus Frackibacter sp. WG13]
MAYKLIAIDMDDTLLSDEFRMPVAVKDAIAQAVAQGVIVTIATGRMYSSALPYVKDLGLDIPIITYNGALVKEAISGQIVNHRPVPSRIVKEIIDLADKEEWHLNLYLNDKLYVNKLGAESEFYEEIAGIEALLIDDFLEVSSQPSTKVLVISKDARQADEISKVLQNKFSEELNITKSKPRFIEIMQKGVSKGIALAELAADLGIKKSEIIAIGDSLNDLEMIQYAGLGVAVANAASEVKERADYITKSNEEAGVAEVIKKFVL